MITIFVEGPTDELLLSRLLDDLGGLLRIVVTGGRDAARPLARKQLLVAKEPVALVIDSDTTDPMRIAQQQRDLEDYLRFGAQGVPFAVIQFVPEAEGILFQNPAVLRNALGREPDESALVAGKFAPRAMVKQLMARNGNDDFASVVARLGEADLREIRRLEPVATLRKFIQQSQGAETGFAATRTA